MRGRTPNPTSFNGDRVIQLGSRSTLHLNRHLPEDLFPGILCRLPVKSLLRFRCVSKSWLALVDDDDFARLHRDTFKNNRDKSRLFVVEYMQRKLRNFTVRCADTFDSISLIPSSLHNDEGRGWEIISSVDGLVLLKLDRVLKLWNPSIRHFYVVPPLPSSMNKKHEVIGLGYDALTKKYKIVIVSEFAGWPSVVIFTIGDKSWDITHYSKQHFIRLFRGVSVYLQGSLYFTAVEKYKDQDRIRNSLWSFDLSNKVFSRISMPPNDTDYQIYSYKRNLRLFLVDGGSSVAMFDSYNNNSILVLDRVTMNWRKISLSNLEGARLLYGKKNGDILISRNHIEGEVGSYCPEKNEYTVLECSLFPIWLMHVSIYVESLFSIS